MADNENIQKETQSSNRSSSASNDSLINNLKQIKNTLEISLYGNTKEDDIKTLDDTFASIIKTEMEGLTRHTSSDVTSFITKLYSKDSKIIVNGQESSINEVFGTNDNSIINFIADAYQSKKLQQNDLKEISSQLIELREAVLVTRDAIISPDTTEGEISKTLKFENENDGSEQYASMFKSMEEKFKLNNSVKNFIIPNALTQGEYYSYMYPYSKLFADFEIMKSKDARYSSINANMNESTLYSIMTESVGLSENETVETNYKPFDDFVKECADAYFTESDNRELKSISQDLPEAKARKERDDAFKETMKEVVSRVSISADEIPLPFLEYGADSLDEIRKSYAHTFSFTEADNSSKVEEFKEKIKLDSGTYSDRKKIERQYRNVGDCYLKYIDSTHLIELKIMDKVLGYYYVLEEDIRPVSNVISSTLYYNRFDDVTRQKTIVDKISERVVASFNKKFLNNNKEFKDLIAAALMNYDLNTKKIKFQFIPAEYICAFKVNEDVDGNGTSILQPSLFYAKLYLMLLLFKIMSIILYSNDTRVNYIKQSGIDKNIANKIQEIARKKQERKLNLLDLFSYTTLVKKIGSGAEMYIPVGRSGERGYETEILQGQEVQMNNELMELLRKCYILGTGVPDAIINYLNEADFAKSIEMANTKFVSRVVSLQLDFNSSLTKFYQMLAKYSLGLPDEECSKIQYILTPPKNANNNIKADAIQATQTLLDFVTPLMYGENAKDDPDKADEILAFRKKVAAEALPMLRIDHLEELMKQSKLEATEEKLNPANNNTDNIDDIDLGDVGV